MKIPFYQVDAFTNNVFGGNPAGICILDEWLPAETMQSIAAENFIPETSFLVRKGDIWHLRWFTPAVEIDLCGHATLAAGHVILNILDGSGEKVVFETASGKLTVRRNGDMLSMNFPSRPAEKTGDYPILADALGAKPKEILKSRDFMAVYDSEEDILRIEPDFDKLKTIKDTLGIIVTAPGTKSDFVSRFFAPNAGIDEDPVTGSAHCTLIPYWSARLGKKNLHALQVSKRMGELFVEDCGERVKIAGKAAVYLEGEISI